MHFLCWFQVADGCNIELQLHLQETTCHAVNPKNFEDCEIRGEADRVNAKQTFV